MNKQTLLKLIVLAASIVLVLFGTRRMSGSAVFWSVIGVWVLAWLATGLCLKAEHALAKRADLPIGLPTPQLEVSAYS
ncbi:MAG: hypothetical protein IPH08_05545 [Rhodocyclaceae bacterium]|nr:hypothetical protein [Rhodocyclaceae bacterium]